MMDNPKHSATELALIEICFDLASSLNRLADALDPTGTNVAVEARIIANRAYEMLPKGLGEGESA